MFWHENDFAHPTTPPHPYKLNIILVPDENLLTTTKCEINIKINNNNNNNNIFWPQLKGMD